MLKLFKVEFFRGVQGVGPFTYVVAKASGDAEILAKAQRILSGSDDYAVEHCWNVHDADLLAKVKHLTSTGLPHIVDIDSFK